MKGDLIEEFVDKKSLQALTIFTDTADEAEITTQALQVATIFNALPTFKEITADNVATETKLVSSFHKNLVLLIQKTWVEKSDEELKAQVLYHLDEFCALLNSHKYTQAYESFFSIVDDVIYLMFGIQTKAKEFSEYALRIDPEFGIFWWYVKSLPRDATWPTQKSRIAILLGMYFLANF